MNNDQTPKIQPYKRKKILINSLIGLLALATLLFALKVVLSMGIINDNDAKTIAFIIVTLVFTGVVVISKKPSIIIASLVGIAITGLLTQVLSSRGLQGTALFYIGLPLLLAYVFKSSDQSPTVTGRLLKGISVVLLLSAPILQEGFICIVMAAPLFYIVGGIIGLIIDHYRKKKHSKLQAAPLLLLIGLMSLEGTHPALTFDRQHTVRVHKVIAANSDAVQQQLNQPLQFGNDIPTFLKIFPFPTVKQQGGTALGQQTTLHFVYYKHFYFSPSIGNLTYQVTDKGENFIESTVTSDDSYVNTYLNWQSSKVSWQAIDENHTKVVWEISYERKLDPAWYFGTLEYFTTSLMANTLIDYAATPVSARKEG